MTQQYSDVVQTAREYYNSADADNFYYHVWGGEDIHIGLYRAADESIADASRRTVARMAELAGRLDENSRVLDLGAGYGGSMRYLAEKFGCGCVALNLSEVENERNRETNRDAGLEHLIEVVDGDFSQVPFEDGGFDIVWSQDAILHSGERERVCGEVARLLKPGGRFVFTDPMQADDAPEDRLQPVYDRIHLDSLGSPGFYRETLDGLGLRENAFEDHSDQLPRHYARVLKALESRADALQQKGRVSAEYVARMKKGLRHWIDAGEKGYLVWGIFVFVK